MMNRREMIKSVALASPLAVIATAISPKKFDFEKAVNELRARVGKYGVNVCLNSREGVDHYILFTNFSNTRNRKSFVVEGTSLPEVFAKAHKKIDESIVA